MNPLKKLMRLMLAVLLLFQCQNTGAQSTNAPAVCEGFNAANQTGNWQVLDADMAISNATPTANNTNYLRVSDRGGASWLFNTTYNANLVNCGTICFDYKVFDDGHSNTADITDIIHIYTGTVEGQTTKAVFRLNAPITAKSAWINICVPLNQVANGAALPGNAQGQWVMTGGNSTTWNTLVTHFVGVAFNVDVAGSSAQDEIIGIDNFCYTTGICCDPNPTPTFTISSLCFNGRYIVTLKANDSFPSTSHGWYLFETSVCGSTADSTTVDANPLTPEIDPVAQAGGVSASFTITDFSKCYFIKHGIWQAGCFGFLDTRMPIKMISAINIFNFENAAGVVQTQFCYGEEVYLDGTESYGENSYYIDAGRRPIGSPAPFDFYAGLGWTSGQIGVVNLSQLFASLPNPVYFEPGYEYSIKLALANLPICFPWTPLEHQFTVVCCDGYINASFDLGSTPIGNNQHAIYAANNSSYNNSSVIHQWYVFSSPNASGGPYTLINQQTGANFTYRPANNGIYYFVVHRIKSSCGDFCFGRSICFDCPNAAGACELCGPIDCAVLDGILNNCKTPINLVGNCANGELSWGAVQGAVGYTVEIQFNDPACCNTKTPPTAMRYQVNTNSFNINRVPMPAYNCFSWKVRAQCEMGESAWSAKQCFSCGQITGKAAANETVGEKTELTPIITPNPNNGSMNLYLKAPGDLTLSVEVYSTYGKLVQTMKQKTIPGGQYSANIKLPDTEKGLYTVVFKTNYGVFSKKVIVQ
jgi:hypothetical protein